MKTIEVTDEVYAKLIALATEMTTQDPRCTTGPHLFQIQTIEKCAAYEGQGEQVWVNDEGEVDDPEDFVKEYLENRTKNLTDGFEDLDIDDQMTRLDCYQVNQTTREVYQNCFFTAKACQEHIDANHYHYREPINYLNSGWRNPEMELVQEFICGLIGKKMHR